MAAVQIQVIIPPGVMPGQQLLVQNPYGGQVQIVVPQGAQVMWVLNCSSHIIEKLRQVSSMARSRVVGVNSLVMCVFSMRYIVASIAYTPSSYHLPSPSSVRVSLK